jgi:hypothetical protein
MEGVAVSAEVAQPQGLASNAAEGPHLGPLTARDPLVSFPAAATSGPLARQLLAGLLTLLIVSLIWVLVSVVFGAQRSLATIGALPGRRRPSRAGRIRAFVLTIKDH